MKNEVKVSAKLLNEKKNEGNLERLINLEDFKINNLIETNIKKRKKI